MLPARVERVGAVIAPPGFSVTREQEQVDRLTMRRGEALVMLSDGVDGENSVRTLGSHGQEPAGALAARILEAGKLEDDATVAVIRLIAL